MTDPLACYAGPGDSWTYYEIDPAVLEIARDPNRFTYPCASRTRPVISRPMCVFSRRSVAARERH
jgi:hypothetical protein